MEPLLFYSDRGLKERLTKGNLSLGAAVGGQITRRSVFLYNNTDFDMTVSVKVVGDEDVTLQEAPTLIPAKETGEVVVSRNPKITRLTPLKFNFLVDIEYLVK